MFRYLLLGFICCAAYAQTDRDFSGRWFFQPDKSELQALPSPPQPIIRIEQQSGTIHVFRLNDGDRKPEETNTYDTDGRETRHHEGETLTSSRAKWEGSALLTNTVVSVPGNSYTVAEHWRLSRDGSRLTIERHIIRPNGETESTLVYEKESKRAPPKLITSAEPKPPTTDVPQPMEPAAQEPPPAPAEFVVAQGTRLPLRLINSVSTKHSAPGDRVYLETVYPILSHGKVIIPPGSYVMGSLSEVKQAGRLKGKSELYLRFDSITLPNGTTRDLRSRLSNMDGDGKGTLDRSEGSIKGDGGKGRDAKTVATAAGAGASIGAIAGSAAGHLGSGVGIGAAAGALGGLAAVLMTRGPAAVLEKGSTVEMVLDRNLTFTATELGLHVVP